MARPVHPGVYIRRGLRSLGLSNAQAAAILGYSRAFVGELVRGRRGLSVEGAFKVSALLGSTPYFWLRLQRAHDVARYRQHRGHRVASK